MVNMKLYYNTGVESFMVQGVIYVYINCTFIILLFVHTTSFLIQDIPIVPTLATDMESTIIII